MLNHLDLSRIDLNLLVLFEVVMEEKHVGRAAERLNLSASAVSHGLGRLRRLLNDPVFLRTPKGVVPTDRATQLSQPIFEILGRVRSVVSLAEPFNPALSARQFTIGAPDGVSAVFLRPLMQKLKRQAPGINIGIRQLLPAQGEALPERAWRATFIDLEARAIDIGVIPNNAIPDRFHWATLYSEDFVMVVRKGHPYTENPSLDRYCEMQHLVVSYGADPHGFVDQALAAIGKSRRITLTVPNFMFALATVADSDFVTAVPRAFAGMYSPLFNLVQLELPLAPISFDLNIIASHASMMDAGIKWLFNTVRDATNTASLAHSP